MTTDYYVGDQHYTSLSNLLTDGWPDDAVVHVYPAAGLEMSSTVGKLCAASEGEISPAAAGRRAGKNSHLEAMRPYQDEVTRLHGELYQLTAALKGLREASAALDLIEASQMDLSLAKDPILVALTATHWAYQLALDSLADTQAAAATEWARRTGQHS